MYSTHVEVCEILSLIMNSFRGENAFENGGIRQPSYRIKPYHNSKLNKFKHVTSNDVIVVNMGHLHKRI